MLSFLPVFSILLTPLFTYLLESLFFIDIVSCLQPDDGLIVQVFLFPAIIYPFGAVTSVNLYKPSSKFSILYASSELLIQLSTKLLFSSLSSNLAPSNSVSFSASTTETSQNQESSIFVQSSIVSCLVVGSEGSFSIFFLPHPVNPSDVNQPSGKLFFEPAGAE